jgi:iron complex outermembrane receptor protein
MRSNMPCSLRPTPLVLAIAALAAAHPAPAAEPADPAVPTVVITGSVKDRVVGDAPYAISVVDRDELRSGGALVNLSEALARVPGLLVANRSNYAQDLQISSRGFGARAGFGVRGVRLLADGIPASGPDGQGQVSQFDLAGAERVEVLRGPFSVLYGNSSGGVISLVTAPVKRAEAEGGIDIGSAGFQQLRAGVAAPLGGGFSLRVTASEMKVTGFRPRSAAQRELGNVRLGWQGSNDTVTLLANVYRQPAQDPLGLSRDQFNNDPLGTTPVAAQFDTRKESAQEQLGATWKHRFDQGALRDVQLMGYSGQRSVTQYLAIAAGTQTPARHGGGVINFDRDFQGAELRTRWSWDGIDVLLGAALDTQTDERRGYLNYTGTVAAPTYGVIGTLKREETNKARSSDVFAQGEFALGAGLTASAGLRSGSVKLSAQDRFLSNGDDSGSLNFSYTNPVLGLRWQAAPGWQLHASAARGFESPTLGELAYRADGTGGLNTALQAQKSRQTELGSKWRSGPWEADMALFRAKVSDEIGVATNSGGRSAFQNVGRTVRRGLELAGGWLPADGLRGRASMTLLNATYEDNFLTCAGIPCTTPTLPVPAGNRVAGTQRRSGYAELGWRKAGHGELAAEVRGSGRTAVNDANSDFAGGYAVAALRFSHVLVNTDATKVDLLLRVDNVFDRRYAGSVIVNDANGRYFETGTPRAYLLALRISTGR